MFAQLSVKRVESPARKVHVLWTSCGVESRKLQPEAHSVRWNNALPGSCKKKAFQAFVAETADHDTVYRHAIQPGQGRKVLCLVSAICEKRPFIATDEYQHRCTSDAGDKLPSSARNSRTTPASRAGGNAGGY